MRERVFALVCTVPTSVWVKPNINRKAFSRSFLPPLHMTPDTTEREKKRKRDVEVPRITYTAATRTFDRLFKGNDLNSWLKNMANSFRVRGFFGRHERCCSQKIGSFCIDPGVSFPNS